MKVFILINLALQVKEEGDLALVRVEDVFRDRQKAEAVLRAIPGQKVETLQTEMGPVNCVCYRGIYESEMGDD